MPIINHKLVQPGMVDVKPSFIFLNTTDTPSTVLQTGYLNGLARLYGLREDFMAVVSTRPNLSSKTRTVGIYNVERDNTGNWNLASIVPATSALDNGKIYIGSPSNLPVAQTMSGDATITNAGVLTIANDAITTVKIDDGAVTTAKLADNSVTTAKIVDANVTLAKLAPGIIPGYIIRLSGQDSWGGGATSRAITATGALASDIGFAQIEASTTNVSIQKVVVSADTVTVTFSGDPGASTIINWQVLRPAS